MSAPLDRDVGLTFAGGGNRAFYELGLMLRWQDRLLPRAAAIACCSAGASVAIMILTGRRAQAREVFVARTRGLTRNLRWSNLLRGERVAPHASVFRDTLLVMLREGGLDQVRAQPFPVLVLTSAFSRLLPSPLAAALGLGAYQLEKKVRRPFLHPSSGSALRFSPAAFDMRECETPEELSDLVLASSATPPFTPVGQFRGRRLLDGGMIDNAPAFLAEAVPGVRRTVVLLSRPYPARLTGRRGSRLYVAPSGPVPVGRWDYTRPHLLEDAVDMGEREAEIYQPMLDAFLDGAVTRSLEGHAPPAP